MSERIITDNILIAHEMLHHLQSKRMGKLGFMALKLDMSKAYDRVEWIFLEQIMMKMGFSQKFISLISMCIRLVTYSIMLNGQPHGLITLGRGLRQGDSLSPYLFLLVTEGFHALLKKVGSDGEIMGVSLCVVGPRVSHLLFVDDSVVFCGAMILECAKIQSFLHLYEQASGQNINRGKMNIFFSSNTSAQIKHEIQDFLGVPIIQAYDQYLGLPPLLVGIKKKSFSMIKEKIWTKGVEGEVVVVSGEGNTYQGGDPSIPNLHNVLFQVAQGTYQGD